MSSPITTTTTRPCPACGEPGAGRFCAACGASLGGAACAGCAAPLGPGAKFCHRCGLAAGAAPAAGASPASPAAPAPTDRAATVLPWAVAFVAMLALAAMAAGRNFNASKGSAIDGSANALPQASLGEVPQGAPAGAEAPFAGGGAAAGGASGGRPPNLASMSPREIADRLFDRVMLMSSQGKVDSATFFATMALQNYANMGDLDLDLRYDMGRVAEVAGRREVVQAQADTILQRNPTHLLGLVLATKAAAMANDAKSLATFQQRLLAANRSGERQRGLEEYTRHAADIDAAVAAASK
ncbi:MAG: zinc ribbon domain-containing protein [Gemmatirosa sp.]|nr:zinc ribbon domain-containing protein [Gemmatirosa sp.]